jgi:hypothetical protein
MAPRITAGVHVKIRGKVRIHIAAVCLIISQNRPALERLRTACVDDRFGEEYEVMIAQKLFMGIVLCGKIGYK